MSQFCLLSKRAQECLRVDIFLKNFWLNCYFLAHILTFNISCLTVLFKYFRSVSNQVFFFFFGFNCQFFFFFFISVLLKCNLRMSLIFCNSDVCMTSPTPPKVDAYVCLKHGYFSVTTYSFLKQHFWASPANNMLRCAKLWKSVQDKANTALNWTWRVWWRWQCLLSLVDWTSPIWDTGAKAQPEMLISDIGYMNTVFKFDGV